MPVVRLMPTFLIFPTATRKRLLYVWKPVFSLFAHAKLQLPGRVQGPLQPYTRLLASAT